ncbi:hypothetical protein ACLB2K_031323 [Fragaria x ananassa]
MPVQLLAPIGVGGACFGKATKIANQFDRPKHQGIFFTLYTTPVRRKCYRPTAIVYIDLLRRTMSDRDWDFAYVHAVAKLIGLIIFFSGSHFYHHNKPQGSLFVSLARVIVAGIRKRKVLLSSRIEDHHSSNDGESQILPTTTKKSSR